MATQCSQISKGYMNSIAYTSQRGFLSSSRTRRYHSTQSVACSLSSGMENNSKSSIVASARSRSYLAIRNFFTAQPKPLRARQQRLSFLQPFHSLRNHSRSFASTVNTHPTRLTPEEEEWLHNGDILALAPSSGPGPRFDWRKRALMQKQSTEITQRRGDSKRIQRVSPSNLVVNRGQPFYEEIRSYSKRFVGVPFQVCRTLMPT